MPALTGTLSEFEAWVCHSCCITLSRFISPMNLSLLICKMEVLVTPAPSIAVTTECEGRYAALTCGQHTGHAGQCNTFICRCATSFVSLDRRSMVSSAHLVVPQGAN